MQLNLYRHTRSNNNNNNNDMRHSHSNTTSRLMCHTGHSISLVVQQPPILHHRTLASHSLMEDIRSHTHNMVDEESLRQILQYDADS